MGVLEEYEDENGNSALLIAAKMGKTAIVKQLLELKTPADVNYHNKNNETPLSSAYQSGHYDILELLIKAGANDHEKIFKQALDENNEEVIKRMFAFKQSTSSKG